MGAKLVTGRNSDYSLQSKRKTILDKLEDNRTVTGEILCISCEASNLIQEIRPVTVSDGFKEKKVVELDTLYCNLCEYMVLDDKETIFLRNKLK
jgi:hypothetical protein